MWSATNTEDPDENEVFTLANRVFLKVIASVPELLPVPEGLVLLLGTLKGMFPKVTIMFAAHLQVRAL